jgi:hypothetical protein
VQEGRGTAGAGARSAGVGRHGLDSRARNSRGGWVLGVGCPRHGTAEALLGAEQQGRGSSGRVLLDDTGSTGASRTGATAGGGGDA